MSTSSISMKVLLLWLLCLSSALFLFNYQHAGCIHHHEANAINSLAADKSNFMVQRKLEPPPPQQQRRTARQIVEEAFEKSYKHLIDACQKPDQALYHCLLELHTNAPKIPPKYPWWVQTLVRDGSNILGPSGLHGKWHFKIFNTPTGPLQFCSLEKVASTEWNALKCMLDGKDPQSVGDFCLDKPQQLPPVLPKAVFLRDPLERFLSGFVDKCMMPQHRNYEPHCEPSELWAPHFITHPNQAQKRQFIPKEDDARLLREFLAMKRHFFQAYIDTYPLRWNIHFMPAALFCDGLFRNIQHYDFVGYMSGDKAKSQEYLVKFGQRYNITPVVSKIFHLDKNHNDTKQHVVMSNSGEVMKNRIGTASKKIKEYFTPYAAEKLLEFLSIDYAHKGLNLPIPDWVDDMLAQQEQ